ncbi:MAG: hypothetical protein OSJ53_07230, partial [Kineothrix sp.]|nr:hypothetical protein [Kineothrix sp.]
IPEKKNLFTIYLLMRLSCAMLTEFDYYQHTGRQRKTGLGWLKREGAGGGFFAGASNQISLMK